MKNLLFLFLAGLTAAPLFFGCDRSVSDTAVPVDSTALEPEIEISYEILDSGWVQFFDSSRRVKNFGWHTYWGSNGYQRNPKYWFPNGLHEIQFSVSYPDPQYPDLYPGISKFLDTTIYINITNSIPQVDSRRYVKGVWGR
ncbi:hypothetical protein LAG90_18320 [Marinilongibacter aquaticus]|uniref:hypothetical protein n=1 Tax=Marinilongibacter aquaticus TaxID=2975157 RepID=UPI0021BD8661|nr:hypothetical protein [Marinilongibacter aquaticus]UBM58759.1 hypothetical protein LAG90_18320 [Marinilongibacter aquaticus]